VSFLPENCVPTLLWGLLDSLPPSEHFDGPDTPRSANFFHRRHFHGCFHTLAPASASFADSAGVYK
jgi:hypothetical protein